MGVTPHIDSAGGAYVPVFAMKLWRALSAWLIARVG